MLTPLIRVTVTVVAAFRWLFDGLVVLLLLAVLLLFGLQYDHPSSWDELKPVVALHQVGDPLLAAFGGSIFQPDADAGPLWPASEIRYFPLALAALLLAVRFAVKNGADAVVRSGRRRLKAKSVEGRRQLRRPEGDDLPSRGRPGEPSGLDGAAPLPGTVGRPTSPHGPQASGWQPGSGTPAESPRQPQHTPWPPAEAPAPRPPSSGDVTGNAPTLLASNLDEVLESESSGDRTIGRYEIVEELGRGAMGVVYKAKDPRIGRTVAIKKILGSSLTSAELAEFKQRFHREAQAAGQLTHPGLVACYDIIEHEGQSCMVMEFVDGRTLEDLIDEGALSLEESLSIIRQVADALGYAHGQEIVHRDIKPANILVTAAGKVKVTDFGIAKMVGSKLTQTGQILGTPAYMSPEQFSGGQVDSRSDIFSVGSILYRLCTGEPPFPGDTITAIAFKVVQTTPVPVRQLNPELPEEMDIIVSRCLAKNPGKRYPSGIELAADLKRFRSGEPLAEAPAAKAP